MGLHQNGYRDNIGIFRFAGATVSNGAYPSTLPINTHLTGACRNISAGQGITDDKVGVPMGANHPGAWLIPQKAGALSSHNRARGEATATLSMVAGRNLAATSDGTTTAAASLQLVVSLTGTSDGVATATGNVQAALGMAGSASGSGSVTGTIGALAWAYGEAAGSCTATLNRYATGRLYGSITPYTELSPQTLAAAVIAAAEADPITANVARVNGYTVGGNGQSGTEWGPA
jgi:hypothetical protein